MTVADPESTEKFWQLPVAALEQRLGAGPQGLAAGEAAARLKTFGPNKLRAGPHLSLLFKVASRFRNPLVLILLVAAAISAATGELPSFVIISSIVTISILLDSVQEFRAEQAAEALRISVSLKEQVLRDGSEVTVRADDLVPGDVVLLAAGDLVPADGRVIEARDFFVNEALLTGESIPVRKRASTLDALAHTRPGGDDLPIAYAATLVVHGHGIGEVIATGIASEVEGASSRYVSQMYDQAKVLEQAYGTYRDLLKEGRREEANRQERACDGFHGRFS